MKIRNLLLGSVAIAGLSTGGAYAADLGVLTSLDVCDSLGLSGLTISSDTNCLQISGSVEYDFTWGDYRDSNVYISTPTGDVSYLGDDTGGTNWESKVDAWLKFVGTASSDFGKAKAVIKLESVEYTYGSATETGTYTSYNFATDSDDTAGHVYIDEAYVSIGDSTIITAGKADSIFNDGDDVDLGWLQLFNSDKVDDGVGDNGGVDISNGGHVIQLTSTFGDGFSGGVGLEDLAGKGTLVGVVAYSGDGISAHASFEGDGILAGSIDQWAVHAGFAGTFDNFKVVAAGWFDSSDYWNVLASASATFDMFEIAGSVEAADGDYTGVAGSIGATVSDGIKLNVGGRWANDNGDEGYEIAAGIVADVTETLKLTGKVGYADNSYDDVFYGSAELAWAPGGGYTSSVKGTLSSDGGYKIESTFKKTFQ